MRALGNPFVLGGGALIVAVVAAVAVAVALGRDGDETITLAPREVESRRTPTAAATVEVSGLTARAGAVLTLRSGPGSGFISLGVVARGADMEVVARSDSGQWLEVVYPPGSQLRGWVELKDVEFAGDVDGLPVGGAEVFALPEVPTYEPAPAVEVTVTPEVSGPDLVPTDAFVAGAVLVVTVSNVGDTPLAAQTIEVGVYDATQSTIIAASQAGPLSLAPGRSVTIATGYRVLAGDSRRVVIVIDPAQRIEEVDHGNNSLVFVLTGSPATGTPEAPVSTITATPHPLATLVPPSETPVPEPSPSSEQVETPSVPTAVATETPIGGVP